MGDAKINALYQFEDRFFSDFVMASLYYRYTKSRDTNVIEVWITITVVPCILYSYRINYSSQYSII